MKHALVLSERSIPSQDVLAVNLDSYSVSSACACIALFVPGECLYLPWESDDAQAALIWAGLQGEQFLSLRPCLFQRSQIADRPVMRDDAITVTMKGLELPFQVPTTRESRAALLAWQCEDDDATEARLPAITV